MLVVRAYPGKDLQAVAPDEERAAAEGGGRLNLRPITSRCHSKHANTPSWVNA